MVLEEGGEADGEGVTLLRPLLEDDLVTGISLACLVDPPPERDLVIECRKGTANEFPRP